MKRIQFSNVCSMMAGWARLALTGSWPPESPAPRHDTREADLSLRREEAKALASITELAAGRTDLLAQVAGLAIGFSEGALDEPRQRQAAQLLIKVGATRS